MATKVMECDLVVLGAGGVGMPAAVKAAEDSGKKVIVLEKAKKLGGGAMFMHAFPIRDSKWQKDAGETVSNPPDLSGQFFDWLVSKGGAEEYWKVYKPTDTGSIFFGTVHMTKRTAFYKDLPDVSIGPGGTGTYIIDKMRECCDKMKIPVITQARGKKLLVEAGGKVTGVVADTPDGELQVNCKAVFIATGGFGGDYKRLQKLFPVDFNNETIMCLCPRANTGDGIDMAQALGAHIDLDNVTVSESGARYVITVEQQAAAKPNQRGRKPYYVSSGDKKDVFNFVSVKGPPENPTDVILELNDSGERIDITRDKPFRRTDGYAADLRYAPENKNFPQRRVGGKLTVAGEEYNIVAITENEVVLSARSNGKKYTIRYNAAP